MILLLWRKPNFIFRCQGHAALWVRMGHLPGAVTSDFFTSVGILVMPWFLVPLQNHSPLCLLVYSHHLSLLHFCMLGRIGRRELVI